MKILVTGSAGFIGASLVSALLARGIAVVGIDNHNDYYDVGLKEARVKLNSRDALYSHIRGDISEKSIVDEVFRIHRPDVVVNLAAQAGVRYSIENPAAYISANIVGFANILEASRSLKVQHLVYASSSSVYGANSKTPFSTHHSVGHPLSLYAATKRSNELMAHSYSHLHGLPTTGLRFFTVYGPWGRPDMAPFKFTRAILNHEPIDVYNFGNHLRDFTYIDDVVESIVRIIDNTPASNPSWRSDIPDPATSSAPWRVYNVGSHSPVTVADLVVALEQSLGTKAKINFLPLQPGDVEHTFADVQDLVVEIGFKPQTPVAHGVDEFVRWYRSYFHLE